MNKISKDKRDKVILLALVFVGLAGVLYTFVLGAQKDRLATLNRQIVITHDKLGKAERLIRSAPTFEASLKVNQKVIAERQEAMAPEGQYYYWFLKLVDQFRDQERLSPSFVIDITQPEFIEAGLLPNFPFKAASFGLRLNGQFHEVGKFVADMENTYPLFRIQTVKMAPQRGSILGDVIKQSPAMPSTTEKVVVELRVVTLIRGTTT